MIEGTRPFRGKNQPANPPNEIASRDETLPTPATVEEPNAVNKKKSGEMDRRAWFSSLVPALGDGLVKILRESNHLRDQLK